MSTEVINFCLKSLIKQIRLHDKKGLLYDGWILLVFICTESNVRFKIDRCYNKWALCTSNSTLSLKDVCLCTAVKWEKGRKKKTKINFKLYIFSFIVFFMFVFVPTSGSLKLSFFSFFFFIIVYFDL